MAREAAAAGCSCSLHALQDFGPRGLRIVRLLPKHLSSIDELGRALGQHCRVSFAVFCVPKEPTSDATNDIVAAISGVQQGARSDCYGMSPCWAAIAFTRQAQCDASFDMHKHYVPGAVQGGAFGQQMQFCTSWSTRTSWGFLQATSRRMCMGLAGYGQ